MSERNDLLKDYPQKTADGRTIWACCVSDIGPICNHIVTPAEKRELIASRVRKGYTEPSSRDLLAELLRTVSSGDNLNHALTYNGFQS